MGDAGKPPGEAVPSGRSDGLGVTALYTAQTWLWGGLSHAHLFATPEAKRVFDATNAALALAHAFRRDRVPLRDALMHRHVMIDHLLRASACTRVVELAAGLSRRGAATTCDPAVRYTEVDLPPMIRKKRALLARTDEGRAVLARPNLALVEGDVRELEALGLGGLAARRGEGGLAARRDEGNRGGLAARRDEGGLATRLDAGGHDRGDAAAPLFVIAEGLAMYLEGPARRALFGRVRALGDDVRFVFDLTPSDEEPTPGRAGKLLEAAMKRFTGGKSFERDARSRAQIVDELRDAGFAVAEAIAATDVAKEWSLPGPDRSPTVVFRASARAS